MPLALNQVAADVCPLTLLPRHIRADARPLLRVSVFASGRLWLVSLFLLWSIRLWAAIPAPTPLPQPRIIKLYGQDYIQLNRWAEERDIEWIGRGVGVKPVSILGNEGHCRGQDDNEHQDEH